jgi:hypothetical protein
MSQSILEALYAKLNGSGASFANDVGGRIYETEAPINATYPFCSVLTVATPITRNMDGGNNKRQRVQIDLFATRGSGGESLGDINTKLFALLQGVTLTPVTGHDRGVVTCIEEGIRTMDEDVIRIMSEWQIQGTTT